MKHIKRIFETSSDESNDDQFEEVKSIFTEFMDENIDDYDMDGSPIPRCSCHKLDNYISVSIFKDSVADQDFSDNISGFDDIIQDSIKNINLLKRIKVALSRLEYRGYEWGVKIDYEEIVVKILYSKDVRLSLIDAFIKNDRYFLDQILLKKILLKDYNIKYKSHVTNKSYGGRDNIYLYVEGDNLDKLVSDLRSLKTIDGKWHSNVFNSVRLDNGIIRIEK